MDNQGQVKLDIESKFNGFSISRLHATIRWSGTQWLLNDNNSTNGTFLNGEPVRKWSLLSLNDVIQFSETEIWEIDDLSAPVTALIPANTETARIELYSMHELVTDNDKKLFIYQAGFGEWIISDATSERVLNDKETLLLSNASQWTFQKEMPEAATVKQIKAATDNKITHSSLVFRVSADEEHTFLTARVDHLDFELGERVTHYLLLLLARQKIIDTNNDLSDDDCGWVTMDELQKMMGLDYSHINTYLWRAKKQLEELLNASHLPPLPNEFLLNRRVGSIRLAIKHIEIYRSGKLEAHLIPPDKKILSQSIGKIS